ncbi:hypothetical protein V7968_32015 [Nocardia vulneris]|uniref:WXG100-like domain-containing protein n=1 Tax=Nocardia vulneris TaxID=1141657 RepID=UPI0030CB64F1
MTVAVGHFPDGDEDGMRRVAVCWSDTAEECRALAQQHETAAATISKAVEGETGTEIARKHQGLADTWRARADTADGIAAQVFEGANAVEFEKLVIIGTAVILAAQLVVDALMIGAGGALKALADRAVAEATMRAAWQVLLQRLAAVSIRSAAEHPLLHLTSRATLFGAAQGGGVNLAAQTIQLHDGHRKSIDFASAAIATAAGAAGGAAGIATARVLAPPVLRLVGTSAATRSESFARVFGSAALLGSAGGLVGGIVGAGVAVPLSGGTLDADSLTEAVIPGVAGGLIGAAGAGARAARSAMATVHVPGTSRGTIGNGGPDFALRATPLDHSDPLAPHGIVTMPFDPWNPPEHVAHLPHLPESPVRVNHVTRPTEPEPSHHDVARPVPASVTARTGAVWLGLGQPAPELISAPGGEEPMHLAPTASGDADTPEGSGSPENSGARPGIEGPDGPEPQTPATPTDTDPGRSDLPDSGPPVPPPTDADPAHSSPPEPPKDPADPADHAAPVPPEQHGGRSDAAGTPYAEITALPDEIQTVLNRMRELPGERIAIAHAQELVVARYRENVEIQAHRQYWNQFRDALATEIRTGNDDPDAEQRAQQHAAAVVRTPEARAVVEAEATNYTTRWVNRVGPEQIVQDAWLQDPDAASAAGAAPAARTSHPPVIARMLEEVASTGHPDRVKSAAERLIVASHQHNLTAEGNTFAQKQTRRNLAQFVDVGITGDRAKRLALTKTDEFLRTSTAQRTVRVNAEMRTREWAENLQARAAEWGEDFTHWLSRIDHIAMVRDYLGTVEQRADVVDAARPDLFLKGGSEWMDKLRKHATELTSLSSHLEAENLPNVRLHPDEVHRSVQLDHHRKIRGLYGEIRMVELFLGQVDSVNQLVSYYDPKTSTQWKADIDAITNGGRYWREAKNVPIASQERQLAAWVKQARRQLKISYENTEYWIGGVPPKISWIFINGVDPKVKEALNAIRIEDSEGNLVQDHTIEVLRVT